MRMYDCSHPRPHGNELDGPCLKPARIREERERAEARVVRQINLAEASY